MEVLLSASLFKVFIIFCNDLSSSSKTRELPGRWVLGNRGRPPQSFQVCGKERPGVCRRIKVEKHRGPNLHH